MRRGCDRKTECPAEKNPGVRVCVYVVNIVPPADQRYDQGGVETTPGDGVSRVLTKYVELLAVSVNEDDGGG